MLLFIYLIGVASPPYCYSTTATTSYIERSRIASISVHDETLDSVSKNI
jgi:hypothetical protein